MMVAKNAAKSAAKATLNEVAFVREFIPSSSSCGSIDENGMCDGNEAGEEGGGGGTGGGGGAGTQAGTGTIAVGGGLMTARPNIQFKIDAEQVQEEARNLSRGCGYYFRYVMNFICQAATCILAML